MKTTSTTPVQKISKAGKPPSAAKITKSDASAVKVNAKGRLPKDAQAKALKTRPTANEGTPRYLQIAHALREAIASGRYPVGAQMPTEHELCEQLNVSRFTIREAIRVLSTAGLVHRKPRAGTVVAALPDDTRYTQGIYSLRDLFQYAETTDFKYVYIGRIALSKTLAGRVSAPTGEEWIYAIAIRYEINGERPFGITRLYLNPMLEGIENALRSNRGPVYALIERDYSMRIDRVEQAIIGIILDEHDAANLGVPAGTPGLSITRSYFDTSGRLIELTDNIHPADRFTYRMVLSR
ncbi:GntR family transcriptional regulator [Limnohabitans sp. Rim8]|uniref:GntR family transcriptional regulator n=1 Tax=Limnohabitans sp. Rim8 TaxID=1100718 RepID=UPI0026114B6C|nr:GntR family transcriptional regulator [Limnohabitans sp. Rim8]